MVETPSEPKHFEAMDLTTVQRYLEESDVRFAILFGSHVQGEDHHGSDVDIAIAFPRTLTSKERFHRRNRIDAELQRHAEGFVDVSDLEELPLPIARAALEEGIVVHGDDDVVECYREKIEEQYHETNRERERDREQFIDDLATGKI
jgi:predicted nucleotidyltransferase